MAARNLIITALLFLCLIISACNQAASPAPEATALATPSPAPGLPGDNIVELVEQGALSYRLTSGSINQLGLELRNLRDEELRIAIPAGTFFVNNDPTFQDMVVLNGANVAIEPGARADLLLDVACANLHRSEPTRENSFIIQHDPIPYTLKLVIDQVNQAGVDFPVAQAAVWIASDDASFDELGVLVKDSRFGAPIIDENAAMRAMMLVDQAGLDIHRQAIWKDFNQLLVKTTDTDISAWVHVQSATQAVINQTQSVLNKTESAKVATEIALQEAQFVLTETQWVLEETQFVLTETQWAVDETQAQAGETPSPPGQAAADETYPTPEAGEISQFALNATASSEYSDSRWSAQQTTGAPDTRTCGDNPTAWASASSSGTDWLLLTYDKAVIPTRIVIFETFNPGAVALVELIDKDGNPHNVYTGPLKKVSDCPRQLVIELKDLDLLVESLRVTLKHNAWSEIDAVQLTGKAGG
jgi:lipopolysaccharide export system protein LptC